MTNKWIYNPLTDDQEKKKEDLSKELGISPILCQLLLNGASMMPKAPNIFSVPS